MWSLEVDLVLNLRRLYGIPIIGLCINHQILTCHNSIYFAALISSRKLNIFNILEIFCDYDIDWIKQIGEVDCHNAIN